MLWAMAGPLVCVVLTAEVHIAGRGRHVQFKMETRPFTFLRPLLRLGPCLSLWSPDSRGDDRRPHGCCCLVKVSG
jgi:hypothetical protein